MTREAVQAGFERFVGEAIEETAAEFSVSRALGGESGGMVDKFVGNSDAIHEKIVEPELAEYEEKTITQFEYILDWVESGDPIEAHREKILRAGAFVETIRDDLPPERREAVEATLTARHRSLGEAVEPLVQSPEAEFWTCARTVLERDQASELVEEQFAFTGPIVDHRAAFEMKKTVDPEELVSGLGGLLGSSFDVEFTDEALRAMRHAERSVIVETKRELDEQFE